MHDGEPIPREHEAVLNGAGHQDDHQPTLGINRRKVAALARKIRALEAKENAADAPGPTPMSEPKAEAKPEPVSPSHPAGVIALPTEPTVSFTQVENTTPDGLAVKVFDLEDSKLVTKSAAQIYE